MGAVTASIIGGAMITGGVLQAVGQSNIAKAQAAMADRMRQEALAFAAPTTQELENLTKQVDLYQRMYGQQTAQIDQLQKQITEVYGPAILEQGKIFYDQLRGESSGVMKSFDNQRGRQRRQLEASLIERMGPGALTSSAGVNAMNDFDQKTSDMRAGIEEQSLNNALQRVVTLQGGQATAATGVYNAYTGMSNLLNNIQSGYGDIQKRQANAAIGMSSAMIGTAGSENVLMSGLGQSLTNAAETAGMIYASSMGKGGKTTQEPMGLLPESETFVSPSLGYKPQANPNVSLLGYEPTFGDFTFNSGVP